MRRVCFIYFLLWLSACGGEDKAPAALNDGGDAEAGAIDAGKEQRDAARDASERESGGGDAKVRGDSGDGSVDAKIDGAHSGDGAVDAVDAGRDSGVETPKWSCRESFLSDGVVCDCGCSASDPDCHGTGCAEPGCAAAGCQVCFDAIGAAIACTAPAAWSCDVSAQGDGVCDCGCGAPDSDCAGQGCTVNGCATQQCDRCHGAGGSEIACEVNRWVCEQSVNGSGDGCDCGCGSPDPDCAGSGCSEPGCDAVTCNRCHDVYGRVAPCAQWACPPLLYADGQYCDCGCDRPDPDCNQKGCIEYSCEDDSACDYCYQGDGTALMCDRWACEGAAFKDDICDCGCGALDPDCGRQDPGCLQPDCKPTAACEMCVKGSALVSCQWSCDPAKYADGASTGCDCGCGAYDPDCSMELTCAEAGCWGENCDACYDEKGQQFDCKTTNCDPAILGKGDGVCDCGCGGLDPDCEESGKQGCGPVGCGVVGCDRCFDSEGKEIVCWVCDPLSQNDDRCDCGCVARDRACAANQGCTFPGCSVSGCQVCHDLNGANYSCGGG